MPGNADLDAFADGPADDAPAGATVCTVAAQTATFERCRAGFYPSPASYDRSERAYGYMAFYRTTPTSAVTHYAPVTERVPEDRRMAGNENATMTETDWAELIEPFADDDRVVVCHLDDLVALDEPVANDGTGLRGAWYHTVGDLREAATLSELAERAERTP